MDQSTTGNQLDKPQPSGEIVIPTHTQTVSAAITLIKHPYVYKLLIVAVIALGGWYANAIKSNGSDHTATIRTDLQEFRDEIKTKIETVRLEQKEGRREQQEALASLRTEVLARIDNLDRQAADLDRSAIGHGGQIKDLARRIQILETEREVDRREWRDMMRDYTRLRDGAR